MIHIKSYELFEELYEGPSISIPDDLAVWFMNYYAVQTTGDFPSDADIPKNLIDASRSVMDEYADGYMYRGMYLANAPDKPVKSGPLNKRVSWTFDMETAAAFAKKKTGDGIPVMLRVKCKDLRCAVSVDVVMENIMPKQIELTNSTTKRYIEDYYSESEFIILDELTIPLNDVSINGKGFGL